MNESASISTWNLLPELGFAPDSKVVSDIMPGLSINFGNLKLSASYLMSMQFAKIVLLSGVLKTPDSIAEIHIEMPRQVSSREQCYAWIVWHLDEHSKRGVFKPINEYGWIAEGRKNKHLLPWVADMMAYEASPICEVRRDWARIALNTMAEYFKVDTSSKVIFSFDGNVLRIDYTGKVIPLPGKGKKWPNSYSIPARCLENLPKRLMKERVFFSIWKSQLYIGGYVYPGVEEVLL